MSTMSPAAAVAGDASTRGTPMYRYHCAACNASPVQSLILVDENVVAHPDHADDARALLEAERVTASAERRSATCRGLQEAIVAHRLTQPPAEFTDGAVFTLPNGISWTRHNGLWAQPETKTPLPTDDAAIRRLWQASPVVPVYTVPNRS